MKLAYSRYYGKVRIVLHRIYTTISYYIVNIECILFIGILQFRLTGFIIGFGGNYPL